MLRMILRRLTSTPDPHTLTVLGPTSADDAWAVLLLVNDWIKHAEAKLGVIFALVGLLAAGLIALVTDVEEPNSALLSASLISGMLIVFSAICATMGLLPKFRAQKNAHDVNLLFYGDVAAHFQGRGKELAYVKELEAVLADHDTLSRQIARQAWVNSAVAARKYKWANWAILSGAVAVLSALVTGIIAVRWS